MLSPPQSSESDASGMEERNSSLRSNPEDFAVKPNLRTIGRGERV